MTRIGPKQDINNPYTIIEIAWIFNDISVTMGNYVAQVAAEDPNATGPPIVDVSIPFKLLDGSTELLYGRDIVRTVVDSVVIYTYDTDLVSRGTMVTYVFLAERFRDYWQLIANSAAQVENFTITTVTPVDPTEDHPLGGTRTCNTIYQYHPTNVPATPEWTGVGPADYSEETYNEFYFPGFALIATLDVVLGPDCTTEWNE